MATCIHDSYWRGHYGTCMACRAEEAEKERDSLRQALTYVEDKWEATQAQRDAALAQVAALQDKADSYDRAQNRRREAEANWHDAKAQVKALREALEEAQAYIMRCGISGDFRDRTEAQIRAALTSPTTNADERE